MNWKSLVIGLVLITAVLFGSSHSVAADMLSTEPATLLVTGLEGSQGSTVGPDGALYVTEGAAGRISRVDPQTGDVTTFASGLPPAIFPIGGVVDVAFKGHTAYALVTIVGSDIGGSNVVGVYRLNDDGSFSIFADLGTFAIENPSESEVFILTGVHYALEPFKNGFLVTDGHHNRVLRVVTRKGTGKVKEFIAFGNIVPTGLARSGRTIFMAQAGPNPHLPEAGKVLSFNAKSLIAKEVASGARMLVDVEFGPGGKLYALSQGVWDGAGEGSPALPNTGALVEVNDDGTFSVVTDGLDRPTSLEFIGNTAYVVTLAGEVWKIENVSD